MSMAPVRIAAAGGMSVTRGTIIRVNITEDTDLEFVPVGMALPSNTPVEDSYINIDWGDGQQDVCYVASDDGLLLEGQYGNSFRHTYRVPGVYRVAIDSRVVDFAFGGTNAQDGTDDYRHRLREAIEAVEQWGPNVVLGSRISEVVDGAKFSLFGGCTNLSSIAPVHIAKIPQGSFSQTKITTLAGCTSSTTTIEDDAFEDSAIEEVSWWPAEQQFVPRGCFRGCPALANVTGLENVVLAEQEAFSGCTALTSIVGLTSLEEAGYQCFAGCTALTRIAGVPNLYDLGQFCFLDCTALVEITSLTELRTAPVGCFKGCTSLTNLSALTNLDRVGDRCFEGCTSLTSLTGLSSVTRVGYRSFGGCTSLTDISGLTVITSLSNACFAGCTALTSLSTFPANVKRISEHCFDGCTGLTTITIPTHVEEIAPYAFVNSGANKVQFPNGFSLTRIDQAAFFGLASTGTFECLDYSRTYDTGEYLRDIKGAPVRPPDGYSFGGSLAVQWQSNASGSTPHAWFTCNRPTFAPWGLSKNWAIYYYSPPTDNAQRHKALTCPDFLVPVSEDGDNKPPSITSGATTRLAALDLLNASYSTYKPLVDFDPYATHITDPYAF